MRIAVYHNQPSGGARRALYELGRRLAARHEIDVFTLTTADEDFLSSEDFAAHVYTQSFSPRPSLRFGLYLNDARRLHDLRELEKVGRKVAAQMDTGGYDIALIDACRFMQSPAVLQYLRLPTVYYCHEPPRRFLQPQARPDAAPLSTYQRARHVVHLPGRIVLDTAVQRADRRNVSSADLVLTNSEHTRRLIQDYYGRDATVAPLGVDTGRFTPGHRKGGYVLSVGALEPHKGFDFLVRAIARIPAVRRPRLVIAGNTDDAGVGDDLRRLAEELGVEVTIAVRSPDAELARSYKEATCFVYSPHGEPFGLAVLEAMASGLPVVAVAEGGPLESVVDGVTGLLIRRDEAEFAAALASVLADPARAAEMGREGRRIAEEDWSWDTASARVERHLFHLAQPAGVTV